MENFIKSIITILICVFFIYIGIFLYNIFDYYFVYIDTSSIKLLGGYYYNIFDNNIYFQILLGIIFIFIPLLIIGFFKNFAYVSIDGFYKYSWKVRNYIFDPLAISLGIIFFVIAYFFLYQFTIAIAILFYDIFNIRFFLDFHIILVFGLIVLFIFLGKLYGKYLDLLLKYNNYIIFFTIFLITILFTIKSDKIIFNDENLCFNNECFLYSDIENINMDSSSYNIEIVLKSVNTKIPIKFSRNDMIAFSECDGDDDGHSYCNDIHEPILDINDRILYILKENDNHNDTTVPGQLFEQKNFEKTLYYIISEESINRDEAYIYYPDYLDDDWKLVLHNLYKKTNLIPKIVDKL
ncbi:hypothetical protein EOM39_04405 [Candidatus Gracilibacteria bacterium]|nr:hypothetical protein [Candidatus Gracilibacteria bacterium]